MPGWSAMQAPAAAVADARRSRRIRARRPSPHCRPYDAYFPDLLRRNDLAAPFQGVCVCVCVLLQGQSFPALV